MANLSDVMAPSGILLPSDIGVTVQGYGADTPTVVASQSEAEAGTSTANRTFTPQRVSQAIAALGANQALSNLDTTGKDKISQAWVLFDGTGTVSIVDSYNVDSITDNGTGDYGVNFTANTFSASNSNYVYSGCCGDEGTAGNLVLSKFTTDSKTTSLFEFHSVSQSANNIDTPLASVVFFGGQ